MSSYQRSTPPTAGPHLKTTARRARTKGAPTEIVLWKVTKGQGHGEHRQRVGNYRIEGFERLWAVNHPGAGRYRLEYRDSKGTIVQVRYANAADRSPPVYTRGRHRPSQRKMPLPLPAWLPPPTLVRTHLHNRDGTPSGRTRTDRLHALPPPPPWDGLTWLLRIDGAWIVPPVGEVIPKGYKAMRMHDGRRVWVPSFNDGWIGFRKLRSSDGEVYFAPNRE